MAIAFRSATSGSIASNAAFTIAVPAGVQVGDLVVVVFGVNNATPVVTPDAQMTARSHSTATSESVWVYYRIINGTEGSTWTFTFAHPSAPSLTARSTWVVSAYSGFTSPAWDDDQYGTGTANSVTTPSATASVTGDLALAAFYNLSSALAVSRNWGTATGMNERGDTSAGSGTGTLALDDDIEAGSGTISGKTAVAGGSFSGVYIAWLGLIRDGTIGTVNVPFISSVSVVDALLLKGSVGVPFIASVTTTHAPIVEHAELDPSFIPSVTALYVPVLAQPEVGVPFIPSQTQVYAPGVPIRPLNRVLRTASTNSGLGQYKWIGDMTEFYFHIDVLFRTTSISGAFASFLHTHDGPAADGNPLPMTNPNIDYVFSLDNIFGGVQMLFDPAFAQWIVPQVNWDVGVLEPCEWNTIEMYVSKGGTGPHGGQVWTFLGRRNGSNWGHNSGLPITVELSGDLKIDEIIFGALQSLGALAFFDNVRLGTDWGAGDIYQQDFEGDDPLSDMDWTEGTLAIVTDTGCGGLHIWQSG